MRISSLFIILGLALLSSSVYAEGGMTYEKYKENASEFCDNPAEWWNDKASGWANLARLPVYARLDPPTILSTMDNIRANESLPELQARLARDLDINRIGLFDGFKTLEVARIQYRNAMDHTFACAVLANKVQTLTTLQKVIWERLWNRSSELQNKLSQEARRMSTIMSDQLKDCASDNESSYTPIAKKLVNTSTLQYCHYSRYLEYLNSNLVADSTWIATLESSLRTQSGWVLPTNTIEWAQSLARKQSAIQKELAKAQRTLPRAFDAFLEMQRTYKIHILLVIIQDDYIKLRDNMSRYMSAVSQLFEKANNAQSPNK